MAPISAFGLSDGSNLAIAFGAWTKAQRLSRPDARERSRAAGGSAGWIFTIGLRMVVVGDQVGMRIDWTDAPCWGL